jgi:chromosomal replication initiation ATPase DnaA
MNSPPRQLALDLPHRSALGAEDFLLSASNRAAIDLIDRWPSWPHWGAVIVGPTGCGKSHLINVWRSRSGAERRDAADLSDDAVRALETHNALAIEDIDRGIGNEQTLFHLLNLARQLRGTVLLTARVAPGDIDIALPDLRSRVRALPVVHVEPPDEALLAAMLVKLFSDRQLAVEPHVVSYIARHMERSTEAAVRIVEAADRLSLESKRRVTRAVAAAAIGQWPDENLCPVDKGPR